MTPITTSITMSSNDQKKFEWFIYLDLHKSSGAIVVDVCKFLIYYHEKLYNLRSLESHGVSYTSYQLLDMSRD